MEKASTFLFKQIQIAVNSSTPNLNMNELEKMRTDFVLSMSKLSSVSIELDVNLRNQVEIAFEYLFLMNLNVGIT